MNPFNYDFNHDGKLDKEDEYLFYEITEGDDSDKQKPLPRHSSGKASIRTGGWITLILAGGYLDIFLKGTIGCNIFTIILAIVAVVVIISVLFDR